MVRAAENVGVISPNIKSIKNKATIFGLLIPSLIIFLLVYLNNTVISKEDIANNTSLTILGTLPHYNGNATNPVFDSPKSHFTESLRSLKVNIQYTQPGKIIKFYGITSTISGEGKTFFIIISKFFGSKWSKSCYYWC